MCKTYHCKVTVIAIIIDPP